MSVSGPGSTRSWPSEIPFPARSSCHFLSLVHLVHLGHFAHQSVEDSVAWIGLRPKSLGWNRRLLHLLVNHDEEMDCAEVEAISTSQDQSQIICEMVECTALHVSIFNVQSLNPLDDDAPGSQVACPFFHSIPRSLINCSAYRLCSTLKHYCIETLTPWRVGMWASR